MAEKTQKNTTTTTNNNNSNNNNNYYYYCYNNRNWAVSLARYVDIGRGGGGVELRKHKRQDLDHRTRVHSTVLCGTTSSAKEGRRNGPGIHRRLCQSSEEIARKLCPIQ